MSDPAAHDPAAPHPALLEWLDEVTRPAGHLLLRAPRGPRRDASLAAALRHLEADGDAVLRLTLAPGEPPEAAALRLAAAVEALYPDFADPRAHPRRRLPELLERLAKRHLAPPSRRLILALDDLADLRPQDPDDNPLPRLLPHAPPRGVFVVAVLDPASPWYAWIDRLAGRARHDDPPAQPAPSHLSLSADALPTAHAPSPPAQPAPSHLSPSADALPTAHAPSPPAQPAPSHLSPSADALPTAHAPSPPAEPAPSDPLAPLFAALDRRDLPAADALLHDPARLAAALPNRLGHLLAALAEARLLAAADPARADRLRDLEHALALAAPAARERPAALPRLLLDRLLDRGRPLPDLLARLRLTDPPRLRRLLPLANRDRARTALFGHVGSVSALAFHPHAPLLASAAADAAIKLWDLPRERERLTLTGHEGAVTGLAFAPDGRLLASAGDDGRVLLWDPDRGARLAELPGHEGGAEALAFAPGGAALLVATGAGDLVLWDLPARARRWTVAAHEVGLTACAVDPAGRLAASGAHDKAVKLWDLATGAPLRALTGPEYAVSGVAFTPDGARLVASAYDNRLRVWDLAAGDLVHDLWGHASWATAVALAPGGRRALSASRDRTLKLWDLERGAEETCLIGHTAMVNACQVAPGGRLAASGAADRSIRLWPLPAADAPADAPVLGHEGPVRACLLLPDARALSASDDSTARLWDAATGDELGVYAGHLHGVTALALAGDRLITASHDRTIKLWARGRLVDHSLLGHVQSVHALALDARGRLASAGADGLRLWDLDARRELRLLPGPALACLFDPQGRLLAAGPDARVHVWDPDTGRELMTLAGHDGPVHALALDPLGARLASAGADGTLRLWDLRRGRERRVLPAHQGPAHAVAFTPAGHLLSAGADAALRLWDPDAARCLAEARGDHPFYCVSVAGDRALAGDHAGNLWHLALDGLDDPG